MPSHCHLEGKEEDGLGGRKLKRNLRICLLSSADPKGEVTSVFLTTSSSVGSKGDRVSLGSASWEQDSR